MKNLSIEEQLRKAVAGASKKGEESNYKSIIQLANDTVVEEPLFKQASPTTPIKPPSKSTYQEPTKVANVDDNQSIYVQPQKVEYNQPKIEIATPSVTPITSPSIVQEITEKDVEIVINLADYFRKLSSQEQNIIKTFVKAKGNELATILVGILNIPEKDKVGLEHLVNLKEEERTSRAFSIISLEDRKLQSIQELILLFNNNYKQSVHLQENRILFCRELEIGIETLSKEVLQQLKPIHQLISLSKKG